MSHEELLGQQLNNYRLVSHLGTGSFSDVYLGEHIHLGTKAAVKVLQPHLTDKDGKKRFLREAQVAATLQHPNIVRILDFGVEEPYFFLITEYASKGSLQARFRGSVVAPLAILPSVMQIAAALHFAHQQGFIHGQVMPRHMLLRQNEEIMLDHFDLSRFFSDQGVMASTPFYVAPEQIRGEITSPATDQYTLGVTLYEWLTGQKLFAGDSSIAIMMKHVHDEVPSLRAIVPTIPAAVELVVFKALAKDPQQRYPSILDFALAFEQACQQRHYPYDVALSFAGEDRSYANALAQALRERRLNVFYDTYERTTLWGKNLYTILSDVYQNKAQYCVMLLSKHYAAKLWTNHEREAAQARAFSENEEYILPIRLDNTRIPGIAPTVAYLSWPPETAETIADMIVEKVKGPPSPL
jgi:serine/threonine protein kinase